MPHRQRYLTHLHSHGHSSAKSLLRSSSSSPNPTRLSLSQLDLRRPHSTCAVPTSTYAVPTHKIRLGVRALSACCLRSCSTNKNQKSQPALSSPLSQDHLSHWRKWSVHFPLGFRFQSVFNAPPDRKTIRWKGAIPMSACAKMDGGNRRLL
jgi:hypothetical protein